MTRRLVVRAAPALILLVALSGCSGAGAGSVDTTGHGAAGSGSHAGSRTVSNGPIEVFPGEQASTALGAIDAMFAAYDSKDLGRWIGAWTDTGYERAFGVTKPEGALVPPSWGDVRSFRESRVEVLDVVYHGQHDLPTDTHTPSGQGEHGRGEHAVVDTLEAGMLTRQRLDLVQQDGRWRVDSRTVLPAPAEGDVVEVDLFEHRIDLASTSAGRDLVLRARNLGDTTHELLLLRDRGGQDVTVARTGPLQRGQTWDLVGRDLPPGSYALVCNELTADGTPHSALGMRALLSVG